MFNIAKRQPTYPGELTNKPHISVASNPITATGSVWPWGHPTGDDRYKVSNNVVCPVAKVIVVDDDETA